MRRFYLISIAGLLVVAACNSAEKSSNGMLDSLRGSAPPRFPPESL
jgi:hypothetical protein